MSEIEQETPSPKQKAPGNPKRVQITQATPTSRPPQPAPSHWKHLGLMAQPVTLTETPTLTLNPNPNYSWQPTPAANQIKLYLVPNPAVLPTLNLH